MNKNTRVTYRPSLTATDVETILTLCKSVMNLTPEVMSVISVLAPFKAKIDNNALTPAHVGVREDKGTIEEQLGFTPARKELDYDTARLVAFNKYEKNPGSCSLKELDLAHTYRYEKGLMKPEEERIYEGNLMNPHTLLSKGMIDTDSPLLDSGDDSIDDDNTDTNT